MNETEGGRKGKEEGLPKQHSKDRTVTYIVNVRGDNGMKSETKSRDLDINNLGRE